MDPKGNKIFGLCTIAEHVQKLLYPSNINSGQRIFPRHFINAFGKFTFALPPLPEQEQIVSELERHLSVADEIEATIGAELTRAGRLRQSILKHAFTGKLVLQDPNDEPASVLLEKIREEKENQQPQRKKTKTKVKRTSSAQQLSLPLD